MDRDAILNLLIGQLREVVPELQDRAIGAADSMADLGANSIDRAEIILNTLEDLNLQVAMVEMRGPRNLGELADLLHAKLSRA